MGSTVAPLFLSLSLCLSSFFSPLPLQFHHQRRNWRSIVKLVTVHQSEERRGKWASSQFRLPTPINKFSHFSPLISEPTHSHFGEPVCHCTARYLLPVDHHRRFKKNNLLIDPPWLEKWKKFRKIGSIISYDEETRTICYRPIFSFERNFNLRNLKFFSRVKQKRYRWI